MSKKYSPDNYRETATDFVNAETSSKRSRTTTLITVLCSAAVSAAAIILLATGLVSNPIAVYAIIGVMGIVQLVFIITLSGLTLRNIRKEQNYRSAVCQRIRGAAAGDMEAAVDDAYDYQPVDSSTREALAAVLAEMNSLKTDNSDLSSQIAGISDDRDEYQFRMIGARMVPALVERAIRKIGRVAEQRRINDITAFSYNLCDLLNSSLRAGRQPKSIAHELALIRTYLDLDDAITGRRTEYRMSVMCSIVGYKLVPHLILPVVENLLEHSERGKTSKYELAVEICSEQDNMVVIIRDNGRGIDVDTLEKIHQQIDNRTFDTDDDPTSLPGINRRIALCYGEQYGLQVTSSKLGTSVRISLPPKPDPFYEE